MLTDAVNQCIANWRYSTWPGISEITTPLRQLKRDWWERHKANEASKRALPAPEHPVDKREHGWTLESAERWVRELERDHDHPARKQLLGIARKARDRCREQEHAA